nr:retrovirus-related Pol polyprotein from transposon TNT 1-94 [Tanacetum cinerariifolium]
MSTQQDIYVAGSENRPPMLNKENYVSWSSRLLWYAKSRPNRKLIYNSIMNSPYVRRMIPEPDDQNRNVSINETFHEQTDDKHTEKELKQVKVDDQAIQTIILDLPEDICVAVGSYETAQEIWLPVQQMMKDFDIRIQEKKAKLFNELEMFTSTDGESIESYHHHFSKLMNDFKRNKHFLKKIVLFHQDKPSSCTYMQRPLPNNNNYNPQPSFNQNYMQQPMPNPEDITDLTTAMNMALALMANAFKLNYSTPTNNNQRISSNPHNRQIGQPGMNMGQDRQMQMVGGNGGNQFRQYVGQNVTNQNGIANQNPNGNGNVVAALAGVMRLGIMTQLLIAQKEKARIQLQAEEFNLMAAATDLDEIEKVNANCILMANLQQASTSGTQTDKALVYDSDESAEAQTKKIVDSLQDKLHDTIYKNAKLRAQLFDTVSEQKNTTKGTSVNTQFYKQSILGKPPSSSGSKLYVVSLFSKSKGLPKIDETHALSKPVTSNSIPTPQESKVVKNDNVIAPGMFRINPFKPSREEKSVPNKVEQTLGKNRSLYHSLMSSLRKMWSPTGRLFDLKGKKLASSKSESQSDCSNGYLNLFMVRRLGLFQAYDRESKTSHQFCLEVFGTVRFGNDHVAVILDFDDLQWENILITKVYFVEGLGHNLFSVRQFCDSDLEVAFRRNMCFVKNLEGVDLLKGNHTTNLYTINLHEMASASLICLMAHATSTKSWLWHQRLSHLNFDTINDLAKNDLVTDLPKFKYHKEHLCPSCEQGKTKTTSHPPKPVLNSKQRLHLLHLDLCGPMRIASINGKRYVLVIMDDYSRYTWNTLTKWSSGRNQTLVEAARTMLILSRALLFLWAETIATAKQDISFLHVFEALCYPKNDREDIGKLGAKVDIGLFIGYSGDSCAYMVYNQETKKIIETMNVTLDELSAKAFEQSSSKPGLQSMTSGQISSPRTVLAAQAPQVLQTPMASITITDIAPTPTNSSSQATNIPSTSQDVDGLETQQQHAQQPENQAPLQPKQLLIIFSNADYVGCKDTFKSTSGGVQFLGEKLGEYNNMIPSACTPVLPRLRLPLFMYVPTMWTHSFKWNLLKLHSWRWEANHLCECEDPLRCGFCLFCDSKAKNSFTYDPNVYSFNDSSSNFNHLPQPHYETYLCELCGNDSHYGYDCQPQFPIVYEQEPRDGTSWNHPTFFNDNEDHYVQYKEHLENSFNEIVATNFNQEKEGPPQDFDIRQLVREECSIEVCEEQNALNSKLLLINLRSQRLDKKKQEVKNIVEQPTKRGTRIAKSLQNFRVKKSSTSLNDTSQITSVHAIAPVLPTEEPEYSLSMDDAFEDVEYVEASTLDLELVSLEEENDSSASFSIFEESDNSLSNNSLPELEKTRSGSTTAHANNPLPKYDSFSFEIEPDLGRLTSVVMRDISDDSSNDPLLEEVDLFLASDNSIPPGNKNIDYDSKGDIHFLEELLVDDSISLPKNESSNFDHHDDPSFHRPPSEPPDVEFFFDFEPNSREVISAVMNNIDEFNEDECFDPGGEINVFANVEDDDYFPFIFVIRIFLPYLIYPKIFPLLLSAGSEDTIFDPDIFV